MDKLSNLLILAGVGFLAGCHPKIKETTDEIYSRHLQKHITLTVISTPVPDNKSDFNLLLLNDGQAMQKAGVKKVVDSLNRKKLIKPLVMVEINAFDPAQQFGVAGVANGQDKGNLASKYADFIVNELLPFVKKKSGVRSFNSVSIAGSGTAGISAIDIAWNNWQKFDNVGFLPGITDEDANVDFSVLSEKIAQSRKKPKLQFWLNQSDDLRNPQQNDSTGMDELFAVLNKKGLEQRVTLDRTKVEKDRLATFRNAFIQFLLWPGRSN